MIGTSISHYRILSSIGRGGMGVVYKAEDIRLGRTVALKFLPEEFAEDASIRARFQREARAASALNHPHVCTIYEVGEDNGLPFIAMEYLEGASLKQILDRGPLPIDRLLDVAIGVIKGLEAAHSQGIIHRDIKPANIFITKGGFAKILDFGLAKVLAVETGGKADRVGTDRRSVQDESSTVGTILGTVQYMSPEQVLGKSLDERSDLFSFGVTLYEMATGGLPFRGDSSPAVLVSIVHDQPVQPRRIKPELSEELSNVVVKCLAKNTDERYQRASEIRNDLVCIKLVAESRKNASVATIVPTVQIQEPASVRGTVSRVRTAFLTTAMVVVLMTIMVGAFFSSIGSKAPRATGMPAPLTVRAISDLPGRKLQPIFSPDGNAIAFAWDGGEESLNTDLYLMQLEGGRPLQLTHHPSTEWPQVYSPDGKRLYFSRQSEGDFASYWIPTLGGDETRVAQGTITDISPDGQLAALVRPGPSGTGDGVFILDLNNGSERRRSLDFGAMSPQFTPDGRWLYVQQGSDRDHLKLYRVAVDGGELEPVSFAGMSSDVDRIEAIELAPGRTRMLITARARGTKAVVRFMANADGSDPKQLPSSVVAGALSPDGRQMISAQTAYVVRIYRADAFPPPGSKAIPEVVLQSATNDYSPMLSPDGSHVLISSYRKGRWELWLWDATFTDGHPIFSQEGGTTGSPTWSHDGKWIAFDARTRTATSDIWLMPVSGKPRILVDDPDDTITPCFDPTSQWVYFTSNQTGTLQLFRISIDGGAATQVTRGGGFTCQFSDDGRYIYYLKTLNGGGIWRLDNVTRLEEPVVPEMKSRNWKVLRDGIYMLDSDNNSQLGTSARVARARFYRFATKRIEELGFRTAKPVGFLGIDLSRDTKWLYYSQVDSSKFDLFLTENLP